MVPSSIGLLSALHPRFLSLPQGMRTWSVVRNFHHHPSFHTPSARFCSCTSKSGVPVSTTRYFEGKFPVRKVAEVNSLTLPRRKYTNGNYWASPLSRYFSTSSDSPQDSQGSEGEMQLKGTIRKCFPNATNIVVEDISGGCGSMYAIFIEAPEFKGLSTVKQHLLVNQALKQEIKSMHGIRIQTAPSK